MAKVPAEVKKEARQGLIMLKNGYQGGMATGWHRAHQLATKENVDIETLKIMRNWFARHGPHAKNGGTSFPGYQRWKKDGSPLTLTGHHKDEYRGAVAYLIWGGAAAYKWIASASVQKLLEADTPKEGKWALRRSS